MLAPGQDLIKIARVLKSNGTDGEVMMGRIDPEEIDLEEPVFIYFDGSPVPFFVENFSMHGGKSIVRLTGVRTAQDAEELIGKDVFVEPKSFLNEDEGEEALSFVMGWSLYDGSKEVGKIADFVDIPGNPCIEVETKNGAALVPLHEDLIRSVDLDAQKIVMDIPAGLL